MTPPTETVKPQKIRLAIRYGRSLPQPNSALVMAISFLPWLAVVHYASGWRASLHLLAYLLVVLSTGWATAIWALRSEALPEVILLVPALGVIVISSVTALWVRLGLPLIWVSSAWVGLSLAGFICAWRHRRPLFETCSSYGKHLIFLSLLVCAIHFAPAALGDLLQHQDGGFTWKYKDTQHFHAIAAAIKEADGSPKTPGTATADLIYHFGAYAPAAAISRFDGFDLGDALARVTRGVEIWALLLACFATGTALSLKKTGSTFGGILSAVGLFFYGSLVSIFEGERNGSGDWTGGLLFTIPDVKVLGSGGPFTYLRQGHSLLHGTLLMIVILGISLAAAKSSRNTWWKQCCVLLLPGLAVPVNSVAAIYCLGVVAILLFWDRLKEWRSWTSMTLMLLLFLSSWIIMGYGRSADSAVDLNHLLMAEWWLVVVSFVAGLGWRVVALRWISKPGSDSISALFLVTVIGLSGFSLLLDLRDVNERYGTLFLQCLFSVFAFSMVTPNWWQLSERVRLARLWLNVVTTGLALLTLTGAVIGAFAVITHRHTGIEHLGLKVLICGALLTCLWVAKIGIRSNVRTAGIVSGVIFVVLGVGFLAWIPDWLRSGIGWDKTEITYSAAEVHGLLRLRALMSPSERFATNQHSLDPSLKAVPPERSYGYSALSERPVLLEGYWARGEALLPWFSSMQHDNEAMFTTTDSQTLRETAAKWKVTWIVARPGTDIALPRPLPLWLEQEPGTGSLKIYRIQPEQTEKRP